MRNIQRLMKLHRLQESAGEHGDAGGGGSTTEADAAAAAATAAAAAEAATAAAAAEAAKNIKPSDAEARLLKDMMKHKDRAKELETQLSQVTEKLKSFEGIDPAKIRAMLAEQEALEQKQLEARGDYDRLLKQMGERHTTEKTTLQQAVDERERVNATLQGQIADLTVGNSFSSSKFVQEDLTLTPAKARVIYGSHFEFKDGSVVGYDKPAGAKERTMLVNAAGDALDFEDAMKKIVEADPDRDHLIRSKMKAGSGSAPSNKGSKKAEGEQQAQLSSVERIAAGLSALAKQK